MCFISNYLTIISLLLILNHKFFSVMVKATPNVFAEVIIRLLLCLITISWRVTELMPILDPGIKWIVNDISASDIFRTKWMQRKCPWTWQKLKCSYQTSHFTDGDIWFLVELMFSLKLNLFRFFQEWCSFALEQYVL